MHSAQWLLADETLQSLDTQGELSERASARLGRSVMGTWRSLEARNVRSGLCRGVTGSAAKAWGDEKTASKSGEKVGRNEKGRRSIRLPFSS